MGENGSKENYCSLAFSSETLFKLEPFGGLHAINSTSKTSVALHYIIKTNASKSKFHL